MSVRSMEPESGFTERGKSSGRRTSPAQTAHSRLGQCVGEANSEVGTANTSLVRTKLARSKRR
jgi:hypothetical protein